MVRDTVSLLHASLKEGKSVLVEGANAAMLDIDFGTLLAAHSVVRKLSDHVL